MLSYVVTGASRGLGLEFVNQLSRLSENTVFALVRDKKTADKLYALGRPNVHVLEADITDVKALKLAAQEVSKITGGKLDVLINNAALIEEERDHLTLDGYPEGQEHILEQDLRKLFDVNVIGPIHTTNVFLPLLRSNTSSPSLRKVISISSGIADPDAVLSAGFGVSAPYAISKTALNMAVVKYAAEYKGLDKGLVYLAISPGFVSTNETRDPGQATGEDLKKYEAMMATFRKLYPDFSGPITPEESVKAMLKVFDKLTIEDSGAFISHKGNKEWL